MKIESYILAHNEEKLMPYIMRHYSQFSDVIILENNSTDRTIEIAETMGATVSKLKRPDTMNTQWQTDIKNQCWKKSKADWVIVADADEFVFHPNLINILENTDATIICPAMFNMFSDTFPTTEGQIYDEVFMGTEYIPPTFEYDPDHLKLPILNRQMSIFKPSMIREINYLIACHFANPEGDVKIDYESEIIILHMKYLSIEYVLERHKRFAARLSEHNVKCSGAGKQYTWSKKDTVKYINEMKATARKIV